MWIANIIHILSSSLREKPNQDIADFFQFVCFQMPYNKILVTLEIIHTDTGL